MAWIAKNRPATAHAPVAARHPVPASPVLADRSVRTSNGLKEFLWLLQGVDRGRLLDLGPVWQSTVNFFIERGFRVTAEDLLRAWKDFYALEEDRLRSEPPGKEGADLQPGALAERFLQYAVAYPPEDFNAILVWDLFDYVDVEMLPRLSSRLFDLLRPGGAVLALFHSKPPDRFHRYRIVDNQTVELVSAPSYLPHRRVFQNREILNLFGQFRSSKTFVGRDQIREGLFLK